MCGVGVCSADFCGGDVCSLRVLWLCVHAVCVSAVYVVCAVCGCEWHVDVCAGLSMGGGCVAWRGVGYVRGEDGCVWCVYETGRCSRKVFTASMLTALQMKCTCTHTINSHLRQ